MKNKKWKYDWDAIQVFYNDGNSWRDVMREFGVSNRAVQKAVLDRRLITRNISESMKLARSKYGPNISGKEACRATSIRQSLHNSGGKCKWYTVNGIKLQGTWERDIAIQFNKMDIQWERPRNPFLYVMNGKLKRYTPDFYLTDYGIYIEVKGYWWGNDKEKMRAVITQNPQENFVIVKKKEFEKILQGEQVWSLQRFEEPTN